MPYLIPPSPSVIPQPQSSQLINRSNPLALGLFAVGWPKTNLYMSQRYGFVSSRDARNLGALAWEAQSVSSSNQPVFTIPTTVSSEITIIGEYRHVGGGGAFQTGIVIRNPSGVMQHVFFICSSGLAGSYFGTSSSGNVITSSTQLSALPRFCQLAITISGVGASLKIYADGIEIGSSSAIVSTAVTMSEVRLFSRTDGYPNTADNGTQCSFFGVWSRALTQKEIIAVRQNPYQLLSKSSKTLFYPDAAPAPTIYEFQSLNRGVGRGIARGIA